MQSVRSLLHSPAVCQTSRRSSSLWIIPFLSAILVVHDSRPYVSVEHYSIKTWFCRDLGARILFTAILVLAKILALFLFLMSLSLLITLFHFVNLCWLWLVATVSWVLPCQYKVWCVSLTISYSLLRYNSIIRAIQRL